MQKVLSPKILALTVINMENFDDFYYKINEKNNKFSLMDKQYCQLPSNIGIFSTYSKSKKNLLYVNFF